MAHFRPLVFFINGVPGSGKDEFVLRLIASQHIVENISSIHCVEELLGIPSSDKSPEARKVKAVVGYAMEEYNQFRSTQTATAVYKQLIQFNAEFDDAKITLSADAIFSPIIFVHAREEFIIKRITQKIREFPVDMFDVFVGNIVMHRPVAERPEHEYSNKADKEAYQITYRIVSSICFESEGNLDCVEYGSCTNLNNQVKYITNLDGMNYLLVNNSKQLDSLQQLADDFPDIIKPLLLEKVPA